MNRISTSLGWLVFAMLVMAGGQLMLGACEVRSWPIFGYAYCPAPDPGNRGGIVAETQRSRVLQSRVRRAELQLAALPVCQAPPERPPLRTEPPPPVEPPVEETKVLPPPPDTGDLQIPARLEDLEGCWQSERGDIEIVTDNPAQRHIGVVRVCYCFDDKGHGNIRQAFKDGDRCRARLRVQLSPDDLKIHHGVMPCSGNKRPHVAESIDCKGTSGQSALCSAYQLGRMRGRAKGEKFHKVSEAACEWSNER